MNYQHPSMKMVNYRSLWRVKRLPEQMDLKGYESVNDLDIRSAGGAQRAVSVLDTALQYVDRKKRRK